MSPFIIFTTCFAGSIALSQYLIPVEYQPIFAAVMFAAAVAGIFFRGKVRKIVIVFSLSLCVGFTWNYVHNQLFFATAVILDGATASVEAEVIDFPVSADYGMSIDMKVSLSDERTVKTTVYFYNESPENLKPGDKVVMTALFSRADRYGEDETSFLTSKGYYLTARGAVIDSVEPCGEMLFRHAHKYAAKAIKDIIFEIFPDSTKGFVTAFLTGDRRLMKEEGATTGAMQRIGVYHIIAISGLHVSVLAGFFFLVFGKFKIFRPFLIPVLLAFMAISGFTPSVVRAVVMHLYFLIEYFWKINADEKTAISIPLVAMLALDPFVIKNVGLQLSFASMAGIIMVSGKIYVYFCEKKTKFMKNNQKARFVFKMVVGGFATSVGALLFTLPLSAIYFGYVSLLAPIVNILIMWMVSPAFYLAVTATAVGAASVTAGKLVAIIASVPVYIIIWFVKAVARIPFAAVYLDNIAVVIWFIVVYTAIFIFAVFKINLRYSIIPAAVSIISLCAIIIIPIEVRSRSDEMKVTVLDVGQGQSIVLTSGKYTAVVDCGSNTEENSGVLTHRYLSGLGITEIDLLVLTHYHDDHANGAADLISYIDVTAIAVPEEGEDKSISENIITVAENAGADVIYVTEDMTVEMGGMVLNLYAPLGGYSDNERCVTVLATDDEFDFLITGDISADTEKLLLYHTDLPDIEAMVIGHHGSKNSTSEYLLENTRPEVAVISVGRNSYGHPSDETLGRLANYAVEVHRTDKDGNIKIQQGK